MCITSQVIIQRYEKRQLAKSKNNNFVNEDSKNNNFVNEDSKKNNFVNEA